MSLLPELLQRLAEILSRFQSLKDSWYWKISKEIYFENVVFMASIATKRYVLQTIFLRSENATILIQLTELTL
jgi:hypothetical protein